ncbi:unnamed protein product [Hymenolepis diminuta]|uniref:Mitogen-activated protein kinase kinase kinase kinase n=1 Tax=Hymenolepis diminuta TaxID=6216 RepID=A0A158QE64_HYMDI|nr:unnamed protein product [Hymenolepis diminuta]
MHHPELAYLQQIVKPSDPKTEYRVLAIIGSGTYGDVYKAQRRDDRRLVAIKIMKIDPKDDIRAICQEIHTLMECSHPNIVQYYGSYLRSNKLWICMEFCGGQSMQDIYLYTRIPLQEDCIAFVTRETLKGLRHMHARNRIHRDIKGANILLTERGEVKIADFGVAAKLSTSMVKRSTVIGTPYWMAPEVASVEHRGTGYDGKCDIWAVGITAIEYAELQPPLFDLDPLMYVFRLYMLFYLLPSESPLSRIRKVSISTFSIPQHDFLANPSLSIVSTRELLDLKRTLEEREKAAFAASVAPAGAKIKVSAAMEPSSEPPPPPIPQKMQQPQPQKVQHHYPPSAAAEQPIWPVSVNRERPRSLMLLQDYQQQENRNGSEGNANRCMPKSERQSPPPQPPKPSKLTFAPVISMVSAAATSTEEGENAGVPPRLRNTSILRSNEPSCAPPITPAGWPPGDHRLLPENCLNESNEDLVAEVLDEYEKRQSKLFYPATDGLLDPEAEMIEEANRLSFYESENFEDVDEFGGTNGLLSTPDTEGLPRMRSKRQAPMPPPLPPKGEGLKAVAAAAVTGNRQSSATAPGPLSNTTTNDSSSQQEPGVISNSGYITGGDSTPTRGGIMSDEEFRGRGTGVPPPRPPPPKFDTACGPLTDYEKSGLRHAERQYQMEHGIGLPPTPKVLMGACFTLIFEGCPLKVNATATWVNPLTKAQMIIFGTNDGIYYLNLQELADATLELLIPRRCIWLTVFRDTMMSLSGNTLHLYSHNLVNVMKAKTSQDPSSGNITGRLPTKLLPKRFQPTVKVSNTRGCYMASVVRNPSNGNKYLCAVIDKSILVMEWFNPRSTFVEVKRVEVPSMPSPVYNFDLVCNRDQSLPTVCLGVYKTSDPNRFRLHMIDLNSDEIKGPAFPFSPEDSLPIVKVAHIDYSVLMLCFQDHAKFVDFRGNVCNNRQNISQIPFDAHVASVVCLRDGILAFHPFGLRGFGFDGQLTQDINDPQHIYQLLGSDKNIVVESRPIDDPMSKSNLYLLFGHENSY